MKIAIFGPLCSGKSTLANYITYYLENKYYQKVEKVSFGAMIYEIAYKLFGMREKDRKLLQDIGRKLRDINEDVFTEYTMRHCREVGETKHIIIEDARIESEFRALLENDFLLIYLDISREKQEERIRRTYPETYQQHLDNLGHSSEKELERLPREKFDLVIRMDEEEGKIENLIEQFIDERV